MRSLFQRCARNLVVCACLLPAAGAWGGEVEVMFWNQTGRALKVQPYIPPGNLHKPSANVYGRLLGGPREVLADSHGTTHDRTITVADSLIAAFEMRFEGERFLADGLESDHCIMKVTPEGGDADFHIIFTGLMSKEGEPKVSCHGTLTLHDLKGQTVDAKTAVPGMVFTSSAKGRLLWAKSAPISPAPVEAKAALH